MKTVPSGPKYYYVVTFSDGSTCRVDHARGPNPALIAAKSQCMRNDARRVARYHLNGTALLHREWLVRQVTPKKKVPHGTRK